MRACQYIHVWVFFFLAIFSVWMPCEAKEKKNAATRKGSKCVRQFFCLLSRLLQTAKNVNIVCQYARIIFPKAMLLCIMFMLFVFTEFVYTKRSVANRIPSNSECEKCMYPTKKKEKKAHNSWWQANRKPTHMKNEREKETSIMLISECMTYIVTVVIEIDRKWFVCFLRSVPIGMNTSFVFVYRKYTHIWNQYRTVIYGILCNLCETKIVTEKQKKTTVGHGLQQTIYMSHLVCSDRKRIDAVSNTSTTQNNFVIYSESDEYFLLMYL